MNERAPIIARPDLQSCRRRALLGFLGLAGWLLWIYLWLPVATFGGWLFGGWLFRRQMVDAAGGGYIVTILGYLLVIVLLAVVFLGWALYNRARFRGVDRRKGRPAVGDAELATAFGVSAGDLITLREARRAVLHFSSEGEIVAIDSLLPPPLPHPHETGKTAITGTGAAD